MNGLLSKYQILLLLLLNLLIRLTFIYFPFWGLEYEDAFIFTDTARQLAHDYSFSKDFFLTNSCILGTIENCQTLESFGGHFLTFPIILYFFNAVVGYNPANTFIVNFIFSSVLLISVCFLHRKTMLRRQFSLEIFLILMLITPFISIFNTSGLSETFSSLIVTIAVMLFYISSKHAFKTSHWVFWAAIGLLIFSFMIKRENIVLLLLFIFVPLIQFRGKKKEIPNGYWFMLGLALIGGLVLFKLFNIISIETNEASDLNAPTFAFSYLVQNAQNMFLALIHLQYFGITGILLLVSILLLALKSPFKPFGILCFASAFSFFLLYSSHYRSYYHVVTNSLSPFEALRYAVNYFPLLCLFIASHRFDINLEVRPMVLKVVGYSAGVILIINVIESRINLSSDEYFSRLEPVEKTLSTVGSNDVIITDIPIVFRCFVEISQSIYDFYALSPQTFDSLIISAKADVYLCSRKHNAEDFGRYNFPIEIERCYGKEFALYNDEYQLIKLQPCY